MNEVIKKTYSSAPVNYREVARYAGAKESDEKLTSLMKSCVSEAEREKAVNFAVCYAVVPVIIEDSRVIFPSFTAESRDLAKNLNGSESVLIFACTAGFGIDRLIKKYSVIDPLRALVFQAFGSERVETFTDVFIDDYEKEKGVRLSPRYSAGYGDLPLSVQKDVFTLLSPTKRLGITLGDSLLMSPSKSITAFAGINGTKKCGIKCSDCAKSCEFRR